jgi:hypothetical protein
MEKIKLSNATEAVIEMAEKEFKEISLKELRNVFQEITWGTIEITIVEGDIENIKITKNYKPLVDKVEKKS